MFRIGVAQTDITPQRSVWLTGYGNRDHRSEGVYQALRAGALFLQGDQDAALLLTADLIGYSSAFAAAVKQEIALATGLHPGQIVLSATHTHCAPFFTPWVMPGQLEEEYAEFLRRQLVVLSVQAGAGAVPGSLGFSRGRCPLPAPRRSRSCNSTPSCASCSWAARSSPPSACTSRKPCTRPPPWSPRTATA